MKRLMMLTMLCMTAVQTFANDINVQIQGAITASACELDSASQNKTVEMGLALASDLPRMYDTGPWIPFELNVINCPPTITAINAGFSGRPDMFNSTAYANIGTGSGVGLQVMDDKNGMYLGPVGGQAVESVNPTTHIATFHLSARYINTMQALVPGSFKSVMQVTFTYR
ncbi:fimbrial protein [Cronobacter dublinensis]|uniref:fimbrial protein n=1 Tax=Cronobacter dublinensis TaxID=413497 RepID=UPI00289582E3|nr:fimbrial protein [Cronobacter dublinensis]MDT3666337.1 fimbrial protein [Cronobacter dublinensis]